MRTPFKVALLGALGMVIIAVVVEELSPKSPGTQLTQAGAAKMPPSKAVQAVLKLHASMAANCSKFLQESGYDAECLAEGVSMYVRGPGVNRVLVRRFMNTPDMVKALRDTGFQKLCFSNSKSGFDSEFYSQDYDLTR